MTQTGNAGLATVFRDRHGAMFATVVRDTPHRGIVRGGTVDL
jgi:hypothetical protein